MRCHCNGSDKFLTKSHPFNFSLKQSPSNQFFAKAGLAIRDFKLNSAGFSVCKVSIGTHSTIYIRDNFCPKIMEFVHGFDIYGKL